MLLNATNISNIVLLILILVALFTVFKETTYYHKLFKSNSDNTEKIHKLVLDITNERINKVAETAFVEAFAVANSSIDTSIKDINYTGFLSKSDKTVLMLFYRMSCPYTQAFMPTWTRVLGNLPTGITYKEVNVDEDRPTTSSYNVNSVPTVILEVGGNRYTYIGSRSYDDLKRFLAEHSVNLVERTFDSFQNTDYPEAPQPTNKLSKRCPLVTFDKKVDIANDLYQYQIFSPEGQYGFAEGGYKAGKIMTPFQAAYSTVDSYLSSLPDFNNLGATTLANVDECAAAYAEDINCFGLCDAKQLDEVANYGKDIQKGKKSLRVEGTDYSSNAKIVNAIKKACRL